MTSKEQNQSKPSILQRLWNQFCSMKFAIIILVIIAIVSVLSLFIGEFYPVKAGGPGWQEYWRQQLGWSDGVFNLFLFLELHDPFRAWWYQILILTLSLSLLTCVIEQLPIVLQSLKIGSLRSSDQILKRKGAVKFVTRHPVDEIVKKLPSLFKYSKEKVDGELRIAGLRGALGHVGPTLSHLGLLCLAVGGLLISILGFKTTVGGYAGDLMTDPGFDFSVRVDSFRIQYYPLGLGQYVLVDDSFIGKIIARKPDDKFLIETMTSEEEMHNIEVEASRLKNQYSIQMDRGNIQDYITTATIIDSEKEIGPYIVEVNKPLRYKGYRFYQTSFDADNPRVDSHIDSTWLLIMSVKDDAVIDTIFLGFNEAYVLPDGSELMLAQFLPDFRLSGSTPVSASGDLRNPAVLCEVVKDGEKQYHQWSFLANPFIHAAPSAPYKFQAMDIFGFSSSSEYMTILAVQKSPGSSVIWIGFIFATLGLLFAFYQIPQRIWVAINEQDDGSCEVVMSGLSSKNPSLFEQKFEDWVKRIRD